jgi:hypothetical protein
MSTRTPTKGKQHVSRQTVTTTTTSSSSRTGAEERSPSPLNISRTEEKDELCHLNDRLANYIEHVRSLELSKGKTSRLLASFQETQRSEIAKVKQAYEEELAELRAAFDRACNEKSAAEVARRHAEAAADDAKRGRIVAENELATLRRQLERAQAQLEKETLLRTELENRIQSMQEQQAFQERLHKEEKEHLVNSTYIQLEQELRGGAEDEYESRLAEALRAMRAETLEELERYRSELEADFRVQFHNLQTTNSAAVDEASKLRIEMGQLRSRWEDAKGELETMVKRCEQLQRDLETQRVYYDNEITRLKNGENELRRQLADRLREFADLMATKVALDQEILAYRKLLEGEESRCQLTPKNRESIFEGSYSSPSGAKSGSKRRRVDLDGESTDSELDVRSGSKITSSKTTACYNMQHRSLGRVNIIDVDTQEALYVTLQSNTTEDIHIGKWTLKYEADGNETVYKFNRNLILKAGATMKIWSMTATQTHSPPEHLVMKGLKFFTGRRIQVTLMDAEDVEQAATTLTYEESGTSHIHSSTYRQQPVEESVSRRYVRGTRRHVGIHERDTDEKCGIM